MYAASTRHTERSYLERWAYLTHMTWRVWQPGLGRELNTLFSTCFPAAAALSSWGCTDMHPVLPNESCYAEASILMLPSNTVLLHLHRLPYKQMLPSTADCCPPAGVRCAP